MKDHLTTFEPLKKIINVLNADSLTDVYFSAANHRKALSGIIDHYDQIWTAGNMLFKENSNLKQRIEILESENEKLKAEVERLKENLDFIK